MAQKARKYLHQIKTEQNRAERRRARAALSTQTGVRRTVPDARDEQQLSAAPAEHGMFRR